MTCLLTKEKTTSIIKKKHTYEHKHKYADTHNIRVYETTPNMHVKDKQLHMKEKKTKS